VFSPPTHDLSASRVDRSIDANEMIRAIANADWSDGGTLLKDRPDGSVLRRPLLGRDLVFKTEPIDTLSRVLQSRAGRSRAHRAWNGARWLIEHELPTATPLALIVGRSGPTRVECLVLESIDGHTLLEQLANETGSPRTHELADVVGRDIAKLFLAGRFNRDHKPSNLIVDPIEPRVTIIDTVAIRPIASGLEPLERMLASLVIEPTSLADADPWSFAERAARAAGAEIVAPGIDLARYAGTLMTRVRRRVDRHLARTPGHNSAGQPLSSASENRA
jgi:hypothetical protein